MWSGGIGLGSELLNKEKAESTPKKGRFGFFFEKYFLSCDFSLTRYE
jgi:hypothetical protein